jgi:holo-[acyl-carrier protein] synthase
MILGIGTDIVATKRIAGMHTRFGDRLAARLLAPQEWDDYGLASRKDRFLAKRFAAKEAFAKAVGTGLRAPVSLSAIRVVHTPLGRPGFAFSPALAGWLAGVGAGAVHLSLSDEQDYAVAFVIVERA